MPGAVFSAVVCGEEGGAQFHCLTDRTDGIAHTTGGLNKSKVAASAALQLKRAAVPAAQQLSPGTL